MIYVYTDGSSSGSVGDGGYSFIISWQGEVVFAGYGHAKSTTNNLMELEGAIQGLEYLKAYPIDDKEGITLVSDSQYVLGIADGSYTPKKNFQSTCKLRRLAQELNIKGMWVRGHNGNELNELCDDLAGMAKRRGRPKQVYKPKRKAKNK